MLISFVNRNNGSERLITIRRTDHDRLLAIAARIKTVVTGEDRQQWQQGTSAEWALESLAIVRAQVYRLPASGDIEPSYTEAARAVIRTRLAQAGARLGWFLNETTR